MYIKTVVYVLFREKTISTDSKAKISTLRKAFPQIIAVSVKNVLLLGFGMTLGFPTILIPSLSGGNPEEKIALGVDAISWIGKNNSNFTS